MVPVLSVLLVLTNPLHHLYYSGFVLALENGLAIGIFFHGPLFWIHVGYSYALSMLGLAIVLIRLLTANDLYRRQMLMLLLACAIPLMANITYVFSLGPLPGQDLTPLMFSLSGLIVAFGILRYRLFSLSPVTYSQVFRTIMDGVVVTDSEGRIVDVNPAAETIFASPASGLVARPVDEFLPPGTSLSLVREKKPDTGPAEIPPEKTSRECTRRCPPETPPYDKHHPS